MKTRSPAKRLAVLARRLDACRPFIRASVVITRKPCIQKSCRACQAGRKHLSPLLSMSVGGKPKNRYLPIGLIEEARRRTGNYRKAKAILDEMSEIWIKELLDRDR